MVMRETKPRDAVVLFRGEYDKPGEKVSRGLPAILPPLPAGQPMDRLGLARWIVDPSNPLTARVWVNRQWEQFFGTGIVKRPRILVLKQSFLVIPNCWTGWPVSFNNQPLHRKSLAWRPDHGT